MLDQDLLTVRKEQVADFWLNRLLDYSRSQNVTFSECVVTDSNYYHIQLAVAVIFYSRGVLRFINTQKRSIFTLFPLVPWHPMWQNQRKINIYTNTVPTAGEQANSPNVLLETYFISCQLLKTIYKICITTKTLEWKTLRPQINMGNNAYVFKSHSSNELKTPECKWANLSYSIEFLQNADWDRSFLYFLTA